MPSFTKDHLLDALRTLKDREGRELIVRAAAVCDGHVSATLALPADETLRRRLRADADAAIRARAAEINAPIHQITIDVVAPDPASPEGRASSPPAPRHIIAVGAGKGGVGKSTIAVNLAVGLARRTGGGHAVGLLDGDIYGPSAPTLMGLHSLEVLIHRNMLQPFYVHGVKTMTIGKLVDPEKPLIWRGPMAHGAFKQLADQTEWGPLDYLIIDLPPGTGDVPLTMAQLFSLTGAVIVCTPQKVAQDDAVRAARMFQTLNIPVLGVVENMSSFIADDGTEYDLFGKGGAHTMAQRLNLPFLGPVPISMELRQNSDAGTPAKNFTGRPALRDALEHFIDRVEHEAAIAAASPRAAAPTLTIS
jgi:ATP-binding protein involved in chromosome partitioning